MAELLLVATLILPWLALTLVGRYYERGLLYASPEDQARRRYRLSWATSLSVILQAGLMFSVLAHWGEQMTLFGGSLGQMGASVGLLAKIIGRPAAAGVASILGMVLVVLYFSLYSLPWMRLDRIAKRAQGHSMRNRQLRLTLRSSLASLLPMAVWFSLVNFLPRSFWSTPLYMVLALAGFLLIVHSFSPWLVQLGQPTAPLPHDHPVARMALELASDAGVRVEAVRVIQLGEARIANALVSGLWPWLRRIYITDHMLATFNVDEIRAILAHEVGHIRHRHLWWYLALAVGGVIAIPRLVDGLAWFDLIGESYWTVLIALGLYWSVMFKFLSRRFERQADRSAVAATGDVATFQSALERLAEVNGMVKQYSKWDIFQTHPPIAERVKGLL